MGRWDKESKQVLVPPRVWGVPPPWHRWRAPASLGSPHARARGRR